MSTYTVYVCDACHHTDVEPDFLVSDMDGQELCAACDERLQAPGGADGD